MAVELNAKPLTLDEMRERGTISIREAGAFLGISASAAYRLAATGAIPTISIGHLRRVSAPMLVELVTAPTE